MIVKNETIGIVVPTYNSGQFVARTIQSVIDQEYKDWILFLSDDGSTDDTAGIVREFMQRDDRIRWLEATEGHVGVCNARRRAIAASDTEWIAFLDSDDVWQPDKLRIQMEAARERNADFLFTAANFVDENDRMLDYTHHVPEWIGYPEILKQDIIHCSSVLIRKELLGNTFLPTDENVCEDFAAWIRIMRDSKIDAAGVDIPLLLYRRRSESRSANKLLNAYRVIKTYQACDLPAGEIVWAWCHYVYRSLSKYTRIWIGKKKDRPETD